MDSGNSGSISSSGDEEYDSRADQSTLLPSTATFFNHHPSQLIGSISHPQSSNSLASSHHHHPPPHPPFFDLSSTYLHSLSHSQPSSNPNNFALDLDTGTSQTQRSEPNCTDPTSLSGSVVSSSAATATGINQCLLTPQGTVPSLQLRSVQNDNATTRVLSPAPPPTNVARNSKKRTRASRRAPTTVLTTDTTNFRAMVQEFTGIPAPPFSSSSYSRRLDLLSGSASTYYPLRPLPQKVQPDSLLLSPSSSSPSPSPSTLLHSNMVDATNNSSCNSSINYQLHPDLGLPYHQHQPPNMMLGTQNQPILSFQPSPTTLHPLSNPFGSKSQASLSVPSLEDLGMNHGQVNEHHLVPGGVSMPSNSHGHVISSEDGCGGGRRDLLRSLDGSCKLNFSASASSSLNHGKTLENNNSNSATTRGEGTAVDSWICSSD